MAWGITENTPFSFLLIEYTFHFVFFTLHVSAYRSLNLII